MPVVNDKPVDSSNPLPVTVIGGGGTATYTPTLSRATAAGTVAAGARSVSIANAGVANGTVGAATLKPGESVSFSADGNLLAAIAYNATGTEFVIGEVR
jgi:hypothetical protein